MQVEVTHVIKFHPDTVKVIQMLTGKSDALDVDARMVAATSAAPKVGQGPASPALAMMPKTALAAVSGEPVEKRGRGRPPKAATAVARPVAKVVEQQESSDEDDFAEEEEDFSDTSGDEEEASAAAEEEGEEGDDAEFNDAEEEEEEEAPAAKPAAKIQAKTASSAGSGKLKKLDLHKDIMPAFRNYTQKNGHEAARKLLVNKFKVKKVSEIPEDKYPEVIKLTKLA